MYKFNLNVSIVFLWNTVLAFLELYLITRRQRKKYREERQAEEGGGGGGGVLAGVPVS
jgi:hypothetical protein